MYEKQKAKSRELSYQFGFFVADFYLMSRVLKMSSEDTTNRTNPTWKCHNLVDPTNTNKFKWNFCGKITNGGVYWAKKHLVGGYRDVLGCPRCLPEVKLKIHDYMGKKEILKEQMQMISGINDYGTKGDDEDDVMEIPIGAVGRGKSVRGKFVGSSQGSVSKPMPKMLKTKGSIDVFFTPNPDVVVKNRKGKQPTIDANDPYKKELRDRAVTKFARWMYDVGIAFNAVKYPSFRTAVESIGQYGPGMKPPSYHETWVTYLKKEVINTNTLLKDHKEDWVKYGCSIIADGWNDRNHRSLIHVLVNCPNGTMFIKSIDTSSYFNDGKRLFEFFDKYVELVGEPNVVLCSNTFFFVSTSNRKVFASFEKVIRFNGYIDARSDVINMMRRFTGKKEMLHRPLHAARHFLNPEFFYSNPQVEQNVEVMTGIYNCITELIANEEIQNKITYEMIVYMKAEGHN
ncbi:uncharacterized protein LOC131302760 [Rhododendron vialii]|uniref:uncharacterized protein LOC131302760 n=1 Tax=Rhododendron vialii TaxID=182163 RepID=UPI00265FB7EF|nr:uncharacterized protein LOC131302760 [Rhododendron vialii]